MSNITGDEGSFSSADEDQKPQQNKLPSNPKWANKNGIISRKPFPDMKISFPDEVVSLSPTQLTGKHRFMCEICLMGFQMEKNLQLHRRGHNHILPQKFKENPTMKVRKLVFVCPEKTCVHHNPTRALGDLTAIKKHYRRKHGEKKWICDRYSRREALVNGLAIFLTIMVFLLGYLNVDSYVQERCEKYTRETNKTCGIKGYN